ncbi:trans-resveratrol di-O-methyltransferase-like [Gossypium australe]|uniref:Trans-resveratrol di-O-methyltransferase-like n=1 Tax=Gossypium australe TaxID=47621 RepID=A0A5B6X1N3_9ROSI|nr:trans-resveratrol di-O-methyltransferase-like [Gossypium australe]
MEKKQSESFRQYAQRWREVATQVQSPLLEKETTMLFINTLKAPKEWENRRGRKRQKIQPRERKKMKKQDPSAQNIQNYEDGPAVDGWERSLAWKRTQKISSKKSQSTNTDGQARPFWLRIQARCKAKGERAGEETRKNKSVTEWERGQMGTDDLSPYI